jgi:hypothetical protein
MTQPVVFETTLASGIPSSAPVDAPVLCRGLIFRLGDYPDRQFSINEAEADAACAAFVPCDADLEHFSVKGTRTVLDRKLGRLLRIWRNGQELWGEASVPRWLDTILAPTERSISLAFHPETKQVLSWGWVRQPQISDAALMAAFSRAHVPARVKGHSMKNVMFSALLDRLFQADGEESDGADHGPEDTTAPIGHPPAPAPAPAPDPVPPTFSAAGTSEREAQLEARLAQVEARERRAQAQGIVDSIIADRRLMPPGREAAIVAFSAALADDTASAVTFALGNGQTGNRVAALRAAFAAVPQHDLTVEQFTVLTGERGPTDAERQAAAAARRSELLNHTDLGRKAMSHK